MVQSKEKTTYLLGKFYKYKTIKELAKKAKITTEQAKQHINSIKKGTNFIYITNKSGNIARQNTTKKPLILRKFGIKRIANKKLLTDGYKNYKGNLFNRVPKNNRPVKLRFNITAGIQFSNDYETRTFETIKTVAPNQINQEYKANVIREFYSIDNDTNIDIINFKESTVTTNQNVDVSFMGLRQEKLCIKNIYNEVIDNKEGHCIHTYLGKIYKKFSKKEILTLNNTNDIYNYCVKHDIKMIAYDINGNVIKANYPKHKNSNRKSLVFIAYDNHLYPLKNSVLHKVKPLKEYNIIHSTNLKDKLIKFLENGILPSNIRYYNKNFNQFVVDNDLYLDNPDYEVCKDVLEKFGLLDHLFTSISLSNIGQILESVFLKEDINSFIPENRRFEKGGFLYHNKKLEYTDDMITIDKNKSYPSSLHNLKYLIKTDYKSHTIKTSDIKKIIPHYLYIVKPEQSSILLPNENVYTGEHIIYCKKEGLKFTIKEEMECSKINTNYYTSLIDKLFELVDVNIAKQIAVRMIGKMERYDANYEFCSFDKIISDGEKEFYGGHNEPLTNGYSVGLKIRNAKHILNKKPIAIQIKDSSRIVVYEMMKKLNIDDKNDLLQIKTDAITFKPKNDDYKKYINKKLSGWKIEKYHEVNSNIPSTLSHTFIMSISEDNDNYLGEQLAGGGKTYTVINDIIPNLEKSYKILSPSHKSLAEYNNKGYNADVIQKYTYKNMIPDEDIIIVDEIGMVGNAGWNLLYECSLYGKKIIAYGDFNQLKPVKCDKLFNQEHFLNLMFKTIDRNWTNRRNDFTKEYYMDIFNENIDYRKEVEKYSTDIDKADFVLVYRSSGVNGELSTRDKYNKIICDKKGIKNLFDKDAMIICNTNNLRDKDIYNNYVFRVLSTRNDIVKLYNVDFHNEVEIPKKDLLKYFNYAYARTLYNIQGDTINSYYWAREDNFFLNGRSAYTIISRLKK